MNNSNYLEAYEMKIKVWGVLLSYHGVMSLALKYFHVLKKATLEPFLEKWHTKIEFSRALNRSACSQLMVFFKQLEQKISELGRDLFRDSQSNHMPANLTLGLMAQAQPLFSWQTDCPICIGTDDGEFLQHLESGGE